MRKEAASLHVSLVIRPLRGAGEAEDGPWYHRLVPIAGGRVAPQQR